MPFQIADNFNANRQAPLDDRMEWSTVEEALTNLPLSSRTEAMLVWIDSEDTWYQFQGGLSDAYFLPAPFEAIQKWYAQLPTPDPVRDIQDFSIGEEVIIKSGDPAPEGGWLQENGATFDPEVYPTLYAFLGTNVLPNKTSTEGTYFIKAEQISIAHTETTQPFDFIGGTFDQNMANLVAAMNALFADTNYSEEVRMSILRDTLGAPTTVSDSMTTLQGWLNNFKRMMVSNLNNKNVAANTNETYYNLINKISDIEEGAVSNIGAKVQARVGTVVQADTAPNAGWLECDGREIDTLATTGTACPYVEYYDYYYNYLGVSAGPYVVSSPSMTGDTTPYGRVATYKGENKTAVTMTYTYAMFQDASPYTTYFTPAQYSYADAEPLYIEYQYENNNYTIPGRNIRKFGIQFAQINAANGYPTHFFIQGYDPTTTSWVDLIEVTDFAPTIGDVTTEYTWTFTNAYSVTAVRMKVVAGMAGSSYNMNLKRLNFYQYVPLMLPNTSTTDRKTWVKVATLGSDYGVIKETYGLGSSTISKGDMLFLPDATSMVSAKTVGLGTTSIWFDSMEYTYDNVDYLFFASQAASRSRNIGFFTNQDNTYRTCVSGNAAVTGSVPSRFFKIGSRIFNHNGNLQLYELTAPELLLTSPTTAWTAAMTVATWTTISNANAIDMVHFDWDGQHYSYLVGTGSNFACHLWDFSGATPTTSIVTMSATLGISNVSTASFFRKDGTLYLVVMDTAYKMYMFKQTDYNTLMLMNSASPPVSTTGAAYTSYPVYNNPVFYKGNYVFGYLAEQIGGFNPRGGDRATRKFYHFGFYNFDSNTFDFKSFDTRDGSAKYPTQSTFRGCFTYYYDNRLFLFSTSSSVACEVNLDQESITYQVMLNGTLAPTFNPSYYSLQKGNEYFLLGTYSLVYDLSRRLAVNYQDFYNPWTSAKPARAMVALESAMSGETVTATDMIPYPLEMTFLVNTGKTAGNFILPKRNVIV